MSIRALADLAVERDKAPPGDSVAQYTDVLTKAIPTESLAAYTAYIAVVQTVTSDQARFLPERWWAFGGFIALTLVAVFVAYYRKLKQARGTQQEEHPTGRWVPLTELAPAVLAAGAWGLALPGGPLSTSLSGSEAVLTISAIIIGGGALVALTAAPARQATSEEAAPDADAPRSAAGESDDRAGQGSPSSRDLPSPSSPPTARDDRDDYARDRRQRPRLVEPVLVLGHYYLVRRASE